MNAALQHLIHGLRKPTPKSRMVTFGDSTVFGIAATATANRWANRVATSLGLTLINQGISGTVLQNRADSQGAPRQDNGLSRVVSALLGNYLSTLYFILYGLNDLRYTGAPDTMNLEGFLADYRTMLRTLIAFGVKPASIVLGSPVWIPDGGYSTGSTGFTGSSRTVHEQYIAGIYALAFEFGCKYAATYEYMRDNGGASLVDADLIHPNDAGHAAIAVAMLAAAVPTSGTWTGNIPTDNTKPVFQSAVATANLVTLTYSETLSNTLTGTPTLSGHTISSASVSGATVRIIPGEAITNGEVLTITTPAGYVRDASANANQADALTAQAVTNSVPAAGGDTDANDFMSRVATAGGVLTAGEESAMRTWVADAKAKGYWTALARFQPMLGDNVARLVPLKGSGNDTNVGTTYAANTGAVANGTSQYLNTGYNPTGTTGGVSIYLRTTIASSTTIRIPIGVRDTANTHAYRLTANSGSNGSASSGSVAGIWGGTAPGPFPVATGGMVAGMWHNSRTDGTTHKLYKNGTLVSTSATSTTPVAPGFPIFVFANNAAGTAGSYLGATASIGAYGIDTGMTEQQAADYYAGTQALMTALGRNV